MRMNNGGSKKQSNYQLSYLLAIILSRLAHCLSPQLVSHRRRCSPSGRQVTDAEATRCSDLPRRHCCSSSRVPIRRCPQWAGNLTVHPDSSSGLPARCSESSRGSVGTDWTVETGETHAPMLRPLVVLLTPLRGYEKSYTGKLCW